MQEHHIVSAFTDENGVATISMGARPGPDESQAMTAAARAAAEIWLMLSAPNEIGEWVFEGDDIYRLWKGAKIFVTIRSEHAKE